MTALNQISWEKLKELELKYGVRKSVGIGNDGVLLFLGRGIEIFAEYNPRIEVIDGKEYFFQFDYRLIKGAD